MAMVDLPEAHAPRREGAPDGLTQSTERFPIARLEQGSARGEFIESRRLRRERASPPAQRPRVPFGEKSLIRQQRRESDGHGNDPAGHHEHLAAVGGDETHQVVLGDDEHEPPVARHRLREHEAATM